MNLQQLWHFVWDLQQEEWPLERPTREETFTEVANFAPSLGVKLDRKDLNFLPVVAAALYQHLKPPAQPPSIPPNLQELVKIHQDHLAKQAALKAKEPPVEFSVDDWIRQLQETVNKKPLTEVQKTTKETAEKEVNQAKEIFRQHVTSALGQELPSELTPPEKIGPISQEVSQGIEAVLGDLIIPEEERETKLTTAINSALKGLPLPEEQKVRAQNIVLEQTKEARETLREQKRVLQQTLQTILVELRPTPEEERLLAPPPAVVRQQANQAIKKELSTTYPLLGKNPAFLNELAEAIIIPLPEEALVNPPRFLEQLRPALPKVLNQAGITPDEKTVRNLGVRTILEQLGSSGEFTREQVETYKKFNILPVAGGATAAAIAAKPKVEPIGASWSEMDYYEVEPGELSRILSVIRHPQTLPAYVKEKAVDLFFLIVPIKTKLFERIGKLTGVSYGTIELAWKFRLTARQLQQQIDWLEGKRAILGLIPNLRPIRPGTKEYDQVEGLKEWQARLEKLEENLPKAGIAGRVLQWRTAFVRAQEKLQTGLYYYQLSTSPLGPRIFTEMVAKRAVRRWIIQPLYERTLGRTFKWLRLKTGLWEWDEEHPGSILTGKRFIRFVGWEKLKESRIGKWVKDKWDKLITLIPVVGTIITAVKRGWRLILAGAAAFFFAFFRLLAVYGPWVGGGFLVGGIPGAIIGAKIGAGIGGIFGGVVGVVVGAFIGGAIGALIGYLIKSGGAWLKAQTAAITTQLGTGGIIPALTAALPEVTGPVVLGGLGIVGGGTILLTLITASAFLTPSEILRQSEFFEVDKTATPAQILNYDPAAGAEIVYSIKILNVKSKLTNISIAQEETKVEGIHGSFTITTDKDGKDITKFDPPAELNPGDSWEVFYTIRIQGDEYQDSTITNLATVTADVSDENLAGEVRNAAFVVTIGNPPDAKPFGYPVGGTICSIDFESRECGLAPGEVEYHSGGLDISGNPDTTVFSTLGGEVYMSGWDDCRGGYVYVKSLPSGFYRVLFVHLNPDVLDEGVKVSPGIPIGTVYPDSIDPSLGCPGSTGPHLHYQILKGGQNQLFKNRTEYVPYPPQFGQVVEASW